MIKVKESSDRSPITASVNSDVENSFTITKRSLSQAEARRIVEEIKETPNITGYTVKEWMQCKHTLVAEDQAGNILGVCMNDDFGKNWTEIAVLIVLKEHRRKGICKALFNTAFKINTERRKNMLIISREPNVLQMMKQLKFDILPSLSNLNGVYKNDRFILSYYYRIRSLMSLYRHTEVIRKKKVFGVSAPFNYGLKHV